MYTAPNLALVSGKSEMDGAERSHPNASEAGTPRRGRFLRERSEIRSACFHVHCSISGGYHTQAEQAGQDESNGKQSEANGELGVLADGGIKGCLRRSVPKGLKRLLRHELVRGFVRVFADEWVGQW